METEIFDSLMKTYLANIHSALKISEIISSHGNESELSEDSIIIGLIYRLMTPMDEKEIDDSLEHSTNIYDSIIYGSDSDSDSDSDEASVEEVKCPLIQNKEYRKLRVNNCNCDICIRARVCILNYKDYESNDSLAQRFKDSISTTCSTHKIII